MLRYFNNFIIKILLLFIIPISIYAQGTYIDEYYAKYTGFSGSMWKKVNTTIIIDIPQNIGVKNFILEGGQSEVYLTNFKISNSNTPIISWGDSYKFNVTNTNQLRFTITSDLRTYTHWTSLGALRKIYLGRFNTGNKVYLILEKIGLQTFRPIQPLGIEIVDHLYLGRGIAGTQLNSKSTGHPAKIRISGQKNMKVKFFYNGRPATNNFKLDLESSSNDRIIAHISTPQFKYEVKGKLEDEIINTYEINGECNTINKKVGRYVGYFVLRVEYDN